MSTVFGFVCVYTDGGTIRREKRTQLLQAGTYRRSQHEQDGVHGVEELMGKQEDEVKLLMERELQACPESTFERLEGRGYAVGHVGGRKTAGLEWE